MSTSITHADLVIMRANFIGGYMGSMLYGANLCVYIAATYFLFNRSNTKGRLHWTMIVFSTLLFAGATSMAGLGIKLDQVALIDSQVDPTQAGLGATQSFGSQLIQNRLNLATNWIYIITNFIADLLILYRLFFVWDGRPAIIVIPGLLFLASTACSIIMVSADSTWLEIRFAIPYFSLSIAVTILATILITIKLMTGRQILKRLLGNDHGTPYVSVAAMIIESAAIYSIIGIFFVAFLVANNPAQDVLNPMVGQAMCLAPNLIIMRVAAGQSFPQGTFSRRIAPSMQFASVPGSSFLDSRSTNGIQDRVGSLTPVAKSLADSESPSSEATLNSSV